MKVWIDFINTPQVSFWVPFIREFKNENNEIILTCRDSGNTVELLKQNGFDFQIIGNKVEKGLFQKALFFPKRLMQLYLYMRKLKPDMAISQSSFYQPIVARFLGVKCLYTNDNEHAKGNLFGFIFANKIVLPIVLNQEKFTKKWPLKSKVSFYPSVKEAIYLSQQSELIDLMSTLKSIIYFRPEPWSAQYYNGPLNFFDQMLLKLSEEYDIVILPRDKNQEEHYKSEKFNKISVADKPLHLSKILSDCKLFIGAGGSMTRELAVLGVPVISIYQAELLCVDKYLVNNGYMMINPNISLSEIKALLEKGSSNQINMQALNDGVKSFNLIKNLIISLK
jgi:hypothetical protein